MKDGKRWISRYYSHLIHVFQVAFDNFITCQPNMLVFFDNYVVYRVNEQVNEPIFKSRQLALEVARLVGCDDVLRDGLPQ